MLRNTVLLVGVLGVVVLLLNMASLPALRGPPVRGASHQDQLPPIFLQTARPQGSPAPAKDEEKAGCGGDDTFTGRRCLSAGSVVPKEACRVFPALCQRQGGPCAQWGGGEYAATEGMEQRCLPKAPPHCTYRDVRRALGTGRWVDEQTYEIPSCTLHTYSRREALRVLRGKRLLFTGDSMVRQLYLRLIASFRGEETFIEHFYHQDSYYAMSDVDDTLLIMNGVPEKSPLKGEVRFEMLFQWDPFPRTYRKDFAALRPDIHFTSYMYWWKPRDPETDIDQYLAAMASHAKERTLQNPGYRLYYLTTPWTAKGTFGGVDDPIRLSRNRHVETLIEKAGVPSFRLLDLASYAEVGRGKFEKTPDGIHYMCIWRPKYPNRIKFKESKLKKDGCKDPVNGNFARVLLNVLDGE